MLELSGIPGDSAAIVVPIGLAVVGGVAIVASRIVSSAVLLIAGAVMVGLGLGLLVWSLTTRETLTLDLRVRRGRHRVRTLFNAGKPTEFGFDQAAGVEFTRGLTRAPGAFAGWGTETWTTRLRLSEPRRTIVLAESRGGTEQSIRSIAEAVARALGVDLIDQTADATERVRARRIGAPLGACPLREATFTPPPDGARTKLSVEPSDERVELSWRTVGGPALPVMGLVVIGGFGLLSTSMTLEATGVLPVLSWIITGGAATRKPAPPGIVFALLTMTGVLWAVWLGIFQTWRWSGRRLIITPEAVTYISRSPLAHILSLIAGRRVAVRWALSTPRIESVRTHDDSIEIRDPDQTRRCLVHLPVPGECAWMAKQVRRAVQVLGESAPASDAPVEAG